MCMREEVCPLVYNLESITRYVLHWKERFAEKGPEQFCSTLTCNVSQVREETGAQELPMETDEPAISKTIATDLEEDKQLRDQLWTERLVCIHLTHAINLLYLIPC